MMEIMEMMMMMEMMMEDSFIGYLYKYLRNDIWL